MSPLRRPAALAVAAVAATLATTPLVSTAAATAAHASTPAPTSAATGASTAAGWAATKTLAVPMSVPSLGTTKPTQPVRLMVALAPRHAADLTAAVKDMYAPGRPAYRRYLTPAETRARYAPTAESVASVVGYLRQQGMTGIEVAGNREAIAATATAAQAEKAFHTSLSDFRVDGTRVYANTAPALVPSRLGGLVTAVVGLHDVPLQLAPLTKTTPAATPQGVVPGNIDGLYPNQLQTTYGATTTPTGKKTTVAVLTEGDLSAVVPALRYAEQKEHSPKVPISILPVGPQSPDTAGTDEWDLDTQASTIMAGGVKHLYMYNVGALSDAQVAFGIETWASQNKATALSASLGGCEFYAYVDGTMATIDSIMQEVALQGRSFMASSGDGGSTGCGAPASLGFPAGAPGDEWPAVGMFTLGVGGTSLSHDDKYHRTTEMSWVGGGGGNSVDELPGFWTAQSDPAYLSALATGESIGGRGLPDVSMTADDLFTPTEIYIGKTAEGIGGTSVSSPLWLGVWARLESAHGNRIGFAPTALYAVYDKANPGVPQDSAIGTVYAPDPTPGPVPGFYDVTQGVNGTYASTPGWDYNTGIGTPNVAALSKAIKDQVARTAPRLKIGVRVVGHHGTKHTLRVTARVLHPGATAATGRLRVMVINGASCAAVVRRSVGACDVVTTTSKRHTLRIAYSGDRSHPAARATKNIVTR